MILENELIRLRAVEPEDADAIWISETDSTQWLQNGMSAPLSRRIILEYALSYDADPFRDNQLRLMIEEKNCQKIIGIADLFEISPIHKNAFAGIYIMPDARSKGFAGMALGLLDKYSSGILNITNIAAKIMEGNQASIRLFEKCGYIRRGVIPSWFRVGDENKDLLLYSKILK